MADRKRAPTAAQKRLSSQRAAAARERIVAAQKRRQLFIVGGSILGIVVIVAALVIAKVVIGSNGPRSGEKSGKAPTTVVGKVSSVPASVFDAVGTADQLAVPKKITGAALTANGRPRLLFVGAEWCPFCAAERWALATALSRFGTFQNLGTTSSSPTDTFPNTQTLSFHGATYTSSHLSFTGYEVQTNQVSGGHYTSLDTPTAADAALWQKYGAGFPFADIGGKYLISGAAYDPAVLQGKTRAQIAAALWDPSSTIAKSVDGAANVISAAICSTTGQQPSAVCSSSGVRAGAAALTSHS